MRRKAFTLVELLVVIGIIAVLVGVLLPALGAARRQAAAVKCASSLREIGNCFKMYALDNKDYAPATKTLGNFNYRITLKSSPPIDFTGTQYWNNFLSNYASKTKAGMSASNTGEAAQARNTIFWGCPAYDPPTVASTTSIGGISTVQIGYGMNAFPEYTPSYPPVAGPPNTLGDSGFSPSLDTLAVATPSSKDNWATIDLTSTGTGRWYKLKAWTRPSDRALAADSRYWLLEAQAAPLNGLIPAQQWSSVAGATWANASGDGETTYDFYRHGKYPTLAASGRFSTFGGKVAFNVLFADGHVSTLTSAQEGYMAARLRYPG